MLSLRNMELHKNYYVESYGGMTSVWYDDVKLGEHMDILSRFPNLEELYLDSNELTDLNLPQVLRTLKDWALRTIILRTCPLLNRRNSWSIWTSATTLWVKWGTWVTVWKYFSSYVY